MTLQLLTVAETIAALEVDGLLIRDIDNIPAEVGLRQALLIPHPNYVSDFVMERAAYDVLIDVTYTLNYRLCYQPVGAERALTLTVWSGMVDMVAQIWDAFLSIGVFNSDQDKIIEVIPLGPANMGIVNDPADRAFYGCDLAFQVKEQWR